MATKGLQERRAQREGHGYKMRQGCQAFIFFPVNSWLKESMLLSKSSFQILVTHTHADEIH
jgi:hypothetical protein